MYVHCKWIGDSELRNRFVSVQQILLHVCAAMGRELRNKLIEHACICTARGCLPYHACLGDALDVAQIEASKARARRSRWGTVAGVSLDNTPLYVLDPKVRNCVGAQLSGAPSSVKAF